MLTKTISVLAVFLLTTPLPLPDEGQWLPSQIRKMDWDKLKARGMKLSKDEFWHPEKGGVLTAAVQINGCSASFVSKGGLVVTNHHCGFGAIQRLSTVDKNYVKNGFIAKTREDELPARGMRVRIVRRIVDVTDKVKAALSDQQSPIERYTAEQQAIRRLVQEAQKAEENTECSISSFFQGRQYLMYYRTLLTDVRLVYAPPRSVGEYGGEVDNWEWPRHTGDFAFFRAYCAPDQTPRGYHKDNVPFEPKHVLKVSRDGVQEGDLVLILGYPGATERYLSSVAVQDRQGIYYPLRNDLFTGMIAILKEASKTSEAKALELSSLIKSLANVEKNALGMIKGLARNAVVERKMREEKQFTEWLKLDKERQDKYGKVLEELIALDKEQNETSAKDMVLGLMLSGRLNPLVRRFCDMAMWTQRQKPDAGPDELRYPRGLAGNRELTKDLDTVQVPTLAMLIHAAKQLPESQQIAGMDAFADKVTAKDLEQILGEWIQNSELRTGNGRRAFLAKGKSAVEDNKDPLIKLAAALDKERHALIKRNQMQSGRRLVVGPKWISAQQQWRGKSFYPDANSTMRVSIASVKGYEPKDGAVYIPHTTVQGVLDKHTGQDPFDAPDALREAAKKRNESRYFNKKIGDVPVCFLSDGDTTGGNSGSPVINGKGELVGLNFDRAFESVSGDYGWNPARSRNISVDVRYVLWFLEQVMPAHHLLEEMGVK